MISCKLSESVQQFFIKDLLQTAPTELNPNQFMLSVNLSGVRVVLKN